MIFYFSGTGNSLYVAKRLNEVSGERLYSIPDCIDSGEFTFSLKPGEKIGFVFPTHCWGTPWIVDRFIENVDFCPADGYCDEKTRLKHVYTFAVITCGSSIGNTDKMLVSMLAEKHLECNAVFSVKMPDSYIVGFDTPDEKKLASLEKSYNAEIKRICVDLLENRDAKRVKRGLIGVVIPGMNKSFKNKGRETKDFYVDDKCDSCGFCASICPTNTIAIDDDGHPVWEKDRCAFCLGCINRCPKSAIQYGSKTEKRTRYVHPVLKGESNHSA